MNKKKRWVSATVNETYSEDPKEGIQTLKEGDFVVLEKDEKGNQTWYKT